MTPETLSEIRNWFNNYVNSFFLESEHAEGMFQMKITHSLNVANNCRFIADGLHWPDSDIILAEILGLLHDAGRFSQVAEFCTFIDPESVDHGQRGYEVVRDNGLLNTLPGNYKNILLDGIRFHNGRNIPEDISMESLPFLKLIRDADKLDIFRIVADSFNDKTLNNRLKKISRIRSNGGVNPAVMEEIRRRRTVSYENVISQADFYMLRLSWVFDINYSPALKKLFESGILEQIIDLLPEDEEVRETAESVYAITQ